MIGVVDSGSTKAHWVFLEGGHRVAEFFTVGLNPNSTSAEVLTAEISSVKLQLSGASKLTALYFYGSGCLYPHGAGIVKEVLIGCFPNVPISVESDLLAAGIALYGDSAGVAAILGTGASCCYYRNGAIVGVAPSLGYVLGDEGSGAFLGKKLLKSYFYNHMPADLIADFHESSDNQKLLFDLYHAASPAGYLASFVPFLVKHRNHPFVDDLVFSAFDQFFVYVVNPLCTTYNSSNLGVVGSIGFEFSDVIKRVTEHHGRGMLNPIQYPIDALIEYHIS